MSECAVILYGRGGSLGNFEIFSRDIVRRLKDGTAAKPAGSFDQSLIFQENVERRQIFFNYLSDPPFKDRHKIKELHILSHSIGAGLFLAYQDPAAAQLRDDAIQKANKLLKRVDYDTAVATEVGAILVDDFIRAPFSGMKTKIRSRFAKDAFIKIWGCNAAIKGWVYSDNSVTDPNDTSVPYYWRALNEKTHQSQASHRPLLITSGSKRMAHRPVRISRSCTKDTG